MTQRANVDLSPLTSFGVAATARELFTLTTLAELPELVRWLDGRSPLILGGGTNLLFTCNPHEPVIQVALRGRAREGTRVWAAAGEPWHPLVQWTLAQGLQGLENLALIPGTVGAAPIQNIGAYGVELVDVFERLRAYDLAGQRWVELDRAACGFGYRESIFKDPQHRSLLITDVHFNLQPIGSAICRTDYGGVRAEITRQRALTTGDSRPPEWASVSPQEVARAVIAIRQQRLPDPAQLGNAGSFFRNPIVALEVADALRERYPALPVYDGPALPDGRPGRKLAAAWLIEHAGWKGVRRGDAGVHAEHALVLVNHGKASGLSIAQLASEIQADIDRKFAVRLEIEPRIVS